MPKRILLVGLLMCLGGIGAIWDVIAALTEGRVFVNFAVLLLPIGIGMLCGVKSSRTWASFCIILNYVICCFGLVVIIAAPQNAYVNQDAFLTWPDRKIMGAEAVPYVLVALSLYVLFLITLHKLLYSPKATAFFDQNSEQSSAPDHSHGSSFQDDF